MKIDLSCPVELWQYTPPTAESPECAFVLNNLSDKVVASVQVTLACHAADGTPIMAVADGYVTVAEFSAGWGGLIVIEHTVNGQLVATAYAHSWQHAIYVTAGQRVKAGDHIGDVGSSGLSTGPHLHFEVRPGGSYAEAIDPEPWLAAHGAIDLGMPDRTTTSVTGCDTDTDADADGADAADGAGAAAGQAGDE